MGASNSRIEEDKALKLCCERKKFVRQALDGRCSLAASHVTYIRSLKIIGNALWKLVEPEAPIESSLYTSTSATPDPLILTDNKTLSQFSFSPSVSQRLDGTENLSPAPSPPTSVQYRANHMNFRGSFSRKVEEKPSVPLTASVTSSTPPSNTPRSVESSEAPPFGTPPGPPETPPWDYFGLFNPVDDHFSSQEARSFNHSLENTDDMRQQREERIPSMGDEKEKGLSPGSVVSEESDDGFDEPSTPTLVRSFENVNRVQDHGASPTFTAEESVASEFEFLNGEKSKSPNLSPLRATSARFEVSSPIKLKTTLLKEDGIENNVAPKDLISSMKDIESLFVKASESGREVPRMLEANKFHFRPIFRGKERGSMTSTLLRSCFSCGEESNPVPEEEPPQTSIKYLTWHRTTSSRSSSSRNPLAANSRDDIDDLTSNLFDNLSMISGSHASTLDRIHAWEKKLYDEVKASEMVRREYDLKCKILRQIESNGGSPIKIDKTRAIVKDLHSRIRVAIHRIDTISKKIEELRDQELQPQLEELIEGLRKMWEVMFQCHKVQYRIISVAYNKGSTKFSINRESHGQIAILIHLESELTRLSSSFTKWVGSQKTYVEAINKWLYKCVSLPQTSSSNRRKRRMPPPPLRDHGPPIYATCGVWLDKLQTLPTKEVADSMKGLAAEVSHLIPRQEGKTQNKNNSHLASTWHNDATALSGDAASEEDLITMAFRTSLVGFLGQMSNFSESSLKMFNQLQDAIQEARTSYEFKSQS